MNLYHWKSKLLANYGDGDIIVMAENVEQAKDWVYELFEPENDKSPFWSPYLEMLAHNEDEEYQEERIKLFNKLREDLNQEPTIVESHVICVRGSD